MISANDPFLGGPPLGGNGAAAAVLDDEAVDGRAVSDGLGLGFEIMLGFTTGALDLAGAGRPLPR